MSSELLRHELSVCGPCAYLIAYAERTPENQAAEEALKYKWSGYYLWVDERTTTRRMLHSECDLCGQIGQNEYIAYAERTYLDEDHPTY